MPQTNGNASTEHIAALKIDLEEHREDGPGSARSPPVRTKKLPLVVAEVVVVHEESGNLETVMHPGTVVMVHEVPLPTLRQGPVDGNNRSLCPLYDTPSTPLVPVREHWVEETVSVVVHGPCEITSDTISTSPLHHRAPQLV